MLKVLVTDCNSRKALCVVRSLGKQGFQVYACCNEKVNMSRLSKHCYSFKYLPDPSYEEKYLNQLIKTLRENSIDVLIPMEDETVELIIKNRDKFNNIRTLLPNYDTFMVARDKGKTMEKANELGVPCPRTYFIRNIDDLKEIQDELIYPVIIKARISSGSRGIMRVNKKEDLIQKYKNIHRNYPSPIIQQYITGNLDKIQVLLMVDKKHKVKAACTYQGIREFPVNGGPVTMWKTISLPKIENKTIKFIEQLKWTGFAEVEYIVDQQTGKYFLMEVNPRFSANIALAVHVGIDFPFLFTKLSLDKEVDFKKNNKFNEYCQWLIPGDILNFIFNKKRFNQDIGYFIKKPKNMHYAILSRQDFLPTIGAILSMILNLYGGLKNLWSKLKASKK